MTIQALYLTTHKTHNTQTSMPVARFEPAIPTSEMTKIYAFDRAVGGMGEIPSYVTQLLQKILYHFMTKYLYNIRTKFIV